MLSANSPYRSQQGISLVEILIDIVIFVILALAIVQLSSLGTRTSLDSEHRTVATGIVNERIEQIRALRYEDIGYNEAGLPPGEPDGVLTRSESVMRSRQTYTVDTTVTLVDDPLNGALPDLTEATADYKKIQVRLSWLTASGDTRSVQTVTYATPNAILLTPTPCVDPSPWPTPPYTPCPTPTPPVAPTATPCVPFFKCS